MKTPYDRKPKKPMRIFKPRWTVAMWIALTLLGLHLDGCASRPQPSPETRPCWIAVLDSDTAMLLRAQAHALQVKAGDLIQTQECARQMSQDLLNEVYGLTR